MNICRTCRFFVNHELLERTYQYEDKRYFFCNICYNCDALFFKLLQKPTF